MSSEYDPAEVLGYLLKHAHQQFDEATAAALAPLGLHPKAFGILRALAGSAPSSQQDIARLLGVDRTTMVSLVDELEDGGFVARRPDPADRRRNVVELTAAGRRTVGRASSAYAGVEADFLGGLGDADRRRLYALLRKITVPTSQPSQP